MIGIITGSGFYDLPSLQEQEEQTVSTEFGEVSVTKGKIAEQEVVFLSRHQKGHKLLPNMINHRANIAALKKLEVECIVSTTVCGMLKSDLPLGKLIVFKELFFPDNRLPNGEICSIYTKENDPLRGHYLCGSHITQAMGDVIKNQNPDHISGLTYAHANGPRFNSKPEIHMMEKYAEAVSQTAGPELVMAGECEIPIVLLGCGVDYANGVSSEPTPPETIMANLEVSKKVFDEAIVKFAQSYQKPSFEGFVYRFE